MNIGNYIHLIACALVAQMFMNLGGDVLVPPFILGYALTLLIIRIRLKKKKQPSFPASLRQTAERPDSQPHSLKTRGL